MLNLQASTPQTLVHQLSMIDIAVPQRREGREAKYRERYMAARFLATLAANNELSFPMKIEHRDSPDFALQLPEKLVGIECVEAISQEWSQILAIRDRDFPEAIIDVIKTPLKPDHLDDKKARQARIRDRADAAKGETPGTAWVGSMPMQYWVDLHTHFISEKIALLRNGNYSDFEENWLLIEDGCQAPVWGVAEKLKAAELCLHRITPLLQPPSFSHIFIGDSLGLIRVHPAPIQHWAIHDLWKSTTSVF